MNVSNANDLVQVSVYVNSTQSNLNYNAYSGWKCRSISGIPCPLFHPGVITAISVTGHGIINSLTCAP